MSALPALKSDRCNLCGNRYSACICLLPSIKVKDFHIRIKEPEWDVKNKLITLDEVSRISKSNNQTVRVNMFPNDQILLLYQIETQKGSIEASYFLTIVIKNKYDHQIRINKIVITIESYDESTLSWNLVNGSEKIIGETLSIDSHSSITIPFSSSYLVEDTTGSSPNLDTGSASTPDTGSASNLRF